MPTALCATTPIPTRSLWRDVVMPKEHGSWSLAFEPVALGLILAPSLPGLCVGVAALAGFLARRPLKLSIKERGVERRNSALMALGLLATVAVVALTGAVKTSEFAWPVWLIPAAVAGAVFLYFDLQNSGRDELAEICGATAFAGVTAIIVAADGWKTAAIWGALFVMASRAVPTVMFVRSYIRGAKTGVTRPLPALTAGAVTIVGALALASQQIIPTAAIAACSLLLLRAAVYLLYPRPRLRARTIGFQELALGAAYVGVLGWVWRF